MRVLSSAALAIGALALAACEQSAVPGLTPAAQSGSSDTVRVASARAEAGPAPTSPFEAYRITQVTPVLPNGADLAWFAPDGGSPREIGAFVGASVIQGLEGLFTGDRDVEVKVVIEQFRPAASSGDAAHKVKTVLVMSDAATGEELGVSAPLLMDLLALQGTASVIARNAGRTPEIRLAERIARITTAWASDQSCATISCPTPIAIAAAPAATPAPAPVPEIEAAPEPAPAPEPVETTSVETAASESAQPVEEVAASEPQQTEEIAAAPSEDIAPASSADAEPASEPSSLFAAIFGEPKTDEDSAVAAAAADDVETEPQVVAEAPALVDDSADVAETTEPVVQVAAAPPSPAPVAVEPAADAAPATGASPLVEDAEEIAEPATTPAPETEAETASTEGQVDPITAFFAGLVAPKEEIDDAAQVDVAEAAVEAPAAPDETAAPAEAIEPAPEPVQVVELKPEEPAPAPKPVFAAEPTAQPTETAPEIVAEAPKPKSAIVEPEVAAAPAPEAQVATQTETQAPPRETAAAGSPFFRSPASTVPTLPQTALLGRSQRSNDPLRRRTGDVVLEVANLPAYWDGDETTGGVWVALPYVPAYRRAVVTNPVNGRRIEANLFWRDPQAGGGSTLLSSEAATALGVSPGEVAKLGVAIVAVD